MTTYKGKPVKTYFEGGRWYAVVRFPDTGYGNTGELDINARWGGIRAAARRAIRVKAPGPIRLEVFAQDIASTNIWYGVTFRTREGGAA